MMTSSLIKILTIWNLFSDMASDYLHGHMAKLRSFCNSCVGGQEFDMDIIGWIGI